MSLRQLRKLERRQGTSVFLPEEPNDDNRNSESGEENNNIINNTNNNVSINNAAAAGGSKSVFLKAVGSDFDCSSDSSISNISHHSNPHEAPTGENTKEIYKSINKGTSPSSRHHHTKRRNRRKAAKKRHQDEEVIITHSNELRNSAEAPVEAPVSAPPVVAPEAVFASEEGYFPSALLKADEGENVMNAEATASCLHMERNNFDIEIDLIRMFGRRMGRNYERGGFYQLIVLSPPLAADTPEISKY